MRFAAWVRMFQQLGELTNRDPPTALLLATLKQATIVARHDT